MVIFMSFIAFNASASTQIEVRTQSPLLSSPRVDPPSHPPSAQGIYVASKVAVNTCLSASAGCFSAMAVQRWALRYTLDLNSMLDGLLAGGGAGAAAPSRLLRESDA